MHLKEWIVKLRELHALAKEGKLPKEHEQDYEQARDQLARAMLQSQMLTLKQGETARRALRIARVMQLQLELPGGFAKMPTLDISSGGCSVLLSPTEVPREPLRFKLKLADGEISGKAKVVSSKPAQGTMRVSFAFEMDEKYHERLETAVFDAALAMLKVD